MTTKLPRLLVALGAILTMTVAALAQQGPATPEVTYYAPITRVEGPQPFHTSLEIRITSPNDLTAGTSYAVTPVLSVLTKPAGVTDATALSYVQIVPSTITFTAPSQTITVAVVGDFPIDATSGEYGYKMLTPGFPGSPVDLGAFINMTVFPAPVAGPPTVVISTPAENAVFTYQPAVGPLVVPFEFIASAPTASPLTSVDADLGGSPVAVTSVVNADGSRTATGSLQITAPGLYTLRARGTNDVGTAEDTTSFTVEVVVPPPTVTIAQPAQGSTYTLGSAGTVAVPFSYTGSTVYGSINDLVATLNGVDVTASLTGLNTLSATGTGTFNLTSAGTYTLTVTTTDSIGQTATATSNFTVKGANLPPTVVVNAPVDGTTITRVAGSGPTTVSFQYTGTAATGSIITSLVGRISGSYCNLNATVTGLNTGVAVGTGTVSISKAGTYTITATATSNGVTASATSTFTIVEVQPPPPACTVKWLPPVSYGCLIDVCSYLPIKFELHSKTSGSGGCSNYSNWWNWYYGSSHVTKIIDKTVVIAVSEIYSNGTLSQPQLFTYGRYCIQGDDYILNYRVGYGCRRYQIEIYRPTSTGAEILSTREVRTRR